MATLFPFKVNWSEQLTMTSEYKTEVIVSRDKTEQRIAWRSDPRIGLAFTASPMRGLISSMFDVLRTELMDEFAVPNFVTWLVAATSAASAANEITVETPLPFWVKADQKVAIVTSAGIELHTIDTVAAPVITLTDVLTGNMAAGAKVYQALSGALSQQTQAKLLTVQAANLSVDFAADPGVNLLFDPLDFSFEDAHSGDGAPILLLKPNWSQGIDLLTQGWLETTDFGIGRVQHDSEIVPIDYFEKCQYMLRDREAVAKMRAFFHAIRGQQKSYWVPDWRAAALDFYEASGSSFTASGVFDIEPGQENVIVFYQDGSYQTNVLTGSSTHADARYYDPDFMPYSGSEGIGLGDEYLIFDQNPNLTYQVGDRLTLFATDGSGASESGAILEYDYDYSIVGKSMIRLSIDAITGTGTHTDWFLYRENFIGTGGTSGFSTYTDYLDSLPRESTVTVQDSWDQSFDPGSILGMLTLVKARSASDTLTISFDTNIIGTTQLTHKIMAAGQE